MATGTRCVVRVAVATQAIRALFAHERPPVPDAEWDEAAYVAQRLHAYADALEGLALVQLMTPGCEETRQPSPRETVIPCARTGDRVHVDLVDSDDRTRPDRLADIERALQRVFADAHAWRRCLLPAYFERHRSWRAVVGAPIQH